MMFSLKFLTIKIKAIKAKMKHQHENSEKYNFVVNHLQIKKKNQKYSSFVYLGQT